MDAVPELPGAAGLVLAGNVVPLDPEPAVLAAMLEGWGRQQRARFLQDRTIAARARLVRRLAEFSGQYPWQWNAAEIEAFFGSLRCGGRCPMTRSRRCWMPPTGWPGRPGSGAARAG